MKLLKNELELNCINSNIHSPRKKNSDNNVCVVVARLDRARSKFVQLFWGGSIGLYSSVCYRERDGSCLDRWRAMIM